MTTHPQTGVTVGLVKDVDDPDRLGRVFVEFPHLPGSPRGEWAHVATPMAGPERGMFFMPEVDDEALVAFHHGDFEHPFIIGYLWNGKDKPPTGDRQVRCIHTTAGHKIEFDDNDGEHSIAITTSGGQRIELDDRSRSITIKTDGIVNVEGTNVNVTATAMLNVKAPIATFSGVVQAKAVITQAIQSVTYAPGVGNLL